MRTIAAATTALALVSASCAFAADMPLKAPPPAAPVLSWTGFYVGAVVGGAWGGSVNYSANDPAIAPFVSGTAGFPGEQPFVTPYSLNRRGPVGGLEVGYNWQAGSNFVLGVEADVSAANVSGIASATSVLFATAGVVRNQTTTSEQNTDWYGTLRGRLGWLATPDLLLFGTGGLAYGHTSVSGNLAFPNNATHGDAGGFSFFCATASGGACFTGAGAQTRSGWTAGGGAEYRFAAHWSAKLEYQFVDLGTQSLKVTALEVNAPGGTLSSLTAAFRDQMNVVRAGLNYHF